MAPATDKNSRVNELSFAGVLLNRSYRASFTAQILDDPESEREIYGTEEMKDRTIESKQNQFNTAMELYDSQKIYTQTGTVVATLNISLQAVLLVLIWNIPLGYTAQVLAFILAYLLTDFLNGLVHMIMDHNENYDSFYGPLVAHFHLHHKTPKYKKKPLPLVYFHETGAKIWLVFFLLIVLTLMSNVKLHSFTLHVLVYIGVLSSLAEVSHYLCHTSNSKTAHVLARAGILLSRERHTPHHEQDNTNYAFLNALTDPLLNLIARKCFPGYKNTTDRHFAKYMSTLEAEQR